jgi:hypothetical protein
MKAGNDMVDVELLYASAAYSACFGVLFALYRFFRRRGAERFPAFLAASALALGLLMCIPGLLHTIAVIGTAVKNDKPYDLRFVWLLTTGIILMHAGVSNVVLSRWIRRAERWAVAASAGTTVLLLAFLAVLNPVSSQASLLVVHGAYLVASLSYLVKHTTGSRVAA